MDPNAYKVNDLINLYKSNPTMFSDDQLDELEKMSQENGIEFKRQEDPFSLSRAVRQASAGFVEGFTTFDLSKEQPRNTGEAIFRQLGHLAGFAPSMLKAPVVGLAKLSAKVLGRESKDALKGNITQGVLSAINFVGDKSIPMIAQKKTVQAFNKGLNKGSLQSLEFLRQGSTARAITEEAVGLASASAISNVWKGTDAILDGFVGGAIAGGAFGGIGNFVSVGNLYAGNAKQVETANKWVRSGVASLFQGLPSTLRNDPTEMQIYEYLLGGYFGYNTRPAHEKEAHKWFTSEKQNTSKESMMYQLNPLQSPEFKKLDPKAQEYILHGHPMPLNSKEPNSMGLAGSTGQALRWLEHHFPETNWYSKAKKAVGEQADSRLMGEWFGAKASLIYDVNVKFQEAMKAKKSNVSNWEQVDAFDPIDKSETSLISLSKALEKSFIKPEANRLRVAKAIKNVQSNAKDSVEDFISGLKEYIKPEELAKNENNLRKWFLQGAEKFQPTGTVKVESWDRISKTQGIKKPKDAGRYFAGEYAPSEKVTGRKFGIEDKVIGVKSKEMPLNKYDKGFEYLTHIIVNGEPQPVLNNFADSTYKTNYKINFPNMSGEMRRNVEEALYEKGRYIYSGVKDKSTLITAEFIDNIGLTPVNADVVFRAMAGGDRNSSTFKTLMQSFRGKTAKLEESEARAYERRIVSNILHTARQNGLIGNTTEINPLLRLNELVDPNKSYIRSASDFNKRMQLFANTLTPLDPKSFAKSHPDGQARWIIVKDLDYIKDKKGFMKGQSGESDSDGLILYSNKYTNTVLKSLGQDVEAGHFKPVILGRGTEGILATKSNGQRASQNMQDFMDANNLDMVIMSSSAKVTGGYQPSQLEYSKSQVRSNDLKPYTVPIADMHVSLGTYENPYKAVRGVEGARQMWSNSDYEINGFNKDFIAEVKESHKGSFEGRSLTEKYNKNQDITSLKEKLESGKIDINELPIDFVLHHTVGQKNEAKFGKVNKEMGGYLLDKLSKLDKEGAFEIDTFKIEGESEFTSYNDQMALVKEGMRGLVYSRFGIFKDSQLQPIKKYVMSRYANPYFKTGGKAWLKGITPDQISQVEWDPNKSAKLKQKTITYNKGGGFKQERKKVQKFKDYQIEEGEIYLDNSFKNMEVRFRQEDGVTPVESLNKRYTLGDVWNIYTGKQTKPKGISEKMVSDALDLVVIRTPSDSISGTRILRLRGWTNQQGAGAFTHAKDNAYLGGADKDSDSVKIYQGMSRKLIDHYKKNKDNKEHFRKHDNVTPDKKYDKYNKHLNELFEGLGGDPDAFFALTGKKKDGSSITEGERVETIFNAFDPNNRLDVARRSHAGQRGLQSGLESKMDIQNLVDYVVRSGGAVEVNSPKDIMGNYILEVRTSDKHGVDRMQYFRDIGSMIVNKSADASTDPSIKDYSYYKNILFNSIFKVKKMQEAPRDPKVEIKGADLEHYKNKVQSNFHKLDAEINWLRGGKSGKRPIFTQYYGEKGTDYKYSREQYAPKEWTPELLKIKKQVEKLTGYKFNSAVVNKYKDGRDSIGHHRDNEPELMRRDKRGPVIASVSLGQARNFDLRSQGKTKSFLLEDGDVFLMKGNTQANYTHGIAKDNTKNPRINITFRRTNFGRSEPRQVVGKIEPYKGLKEITHIKKPVKVNHSPETWTMQKAPIDFAGDILPSLYSTPLYQTYRAGKLTKKAKDIGSRILPKDLLKKIPKEYVKLEKYGLKVKEEYAPFLGLEEGVRTDFRDFRLEPKGLKDGWFEYGFAHKTRRPNYFEILAEAQAIQKRMNLDKAFNESYGGMMVNDLAKIGVMPIANRVKDPITGKLGDTMGNAFFRLGGDKAHYLDKFIEGYLGIPRNWTYQGKGKKPAKDLGAKKELFEYRKRLEDNLGLIMSDMTIPTAVQIRNSLLTNQSIALDLLGKTYGQFGAIKSLNYQYKKLTDAFLNAGIGQSVPDITKKLYKKSKKVKELADKRDSTIEQVEELIRSDMLKIQRIGTKKNKLDPELKDALMKYYHTLLLSPMTGLKTPNGYPKLEYYIKIHGSKEIPRTTRELFYKNVDMVYRDVQNFNTTKDKMTGKMEQAPLNIRPYVPEVSTTKGTVKPKTFDTPPTIEFVKEIKHGDRYVGGLAKISENRILISRPYLKKAYKEKSWTDPKVEGVTPLPRDAFKTYQEMETFVINHEKAHFTKDNRSISKKSKREDHANNIAIKELQKDGIISYVKDINAKALNYMAINDPQIKAVKEFKQHLENHPYIRDNFGDFFRSFTHSNQIGREVDTFSMKDVYAINRFLKRAGDTSDLKFHLKNWHNDPDYIDQDLAFKGVMKKYKLYTAPIINAKGEVKNKPIYGFMSPIGAINKVSLKTERGVSKEKNILTEEQKPLFEFLNKLGTDKSTKLMEKLFEHRENGVPIEQNDIQLRKLNDLTTKFFKDIGEKYIYTKDVTGKALEPNEIESIISKGGSINKYMRFDKKGNMDLKHFRKKVIEGDFSQREIMDTVGVDGLLRYQHEVRRQRGKTKKEYQTIGKFEYEKYLPHMNFGYNEQARRDFAKSIEFQAEAIERKALDSNYKKEDARRLKEDYIKFKEGQAQFAGDYFNSKEIFDYTEINDVTLSQKLKDLGLGNKANNLKIRETNLQGYDKRATIFEQYSDKVINGWFKNILLIKGNYEINNMMHRMEKKYQMSDKEKAHFKKSVRYRDKGYVQVWRDYLKLHLQSILGHQTYFPAEIMKEIDAGIDPLYLKDKRNLFYMTSDQNLVKVYEKMWKSKKWHKAPFINKTMQDAPMSKEARTEYFARKIHNFGRMEAQYELMTLLANTGTWTTNLFSGSANTIGSAGLRNFAKSFNNKKINQVLLQSNGVNNIKLINGKFVNSKKRLLKWLEERGVIDNFILNEFEYNDKLTSSLKKMKVDMNGLKRDLRSAINTPKSERQENVSEVISRYGVKDVMVKYGSFFMQNSERMNRLNAFTAHAFQAIHRFGKQAKELTIGDDFVFEMAMKGVENTQFLYQNSQRPAFMRTATGKVLTRFKLFAWNSIKVRKDFYQQAKLYGYQAGTDQFERAKDLFLTDMFMMSLAGAFMFSIFDTSLAPPYDWIQSMADWMYGDKMERDMAFFGSPLGPANLLKPPIARIPEAMAQILTGDWEQFSNYTAYTLFPFGRTARQAVQLSDDNPQRGLSKAPEILFRIPLSKIQSKIEKAKQRSEDLEGIESSLGEY